MNNYTEEVKQIYNKVCDKYKHHWLDTTVSQTMAMEMITEALSIANVSGCDLLAKARQMRLEQQRKIDSYTEYYNTYEIGTLNGIDGMVRLIEQHYR